MAFKLEKNLLAPNFTPIIEYPTTASTTYKVGEVLKLSSGALVAADVNSDGVQQFICQEDYVAPASGMKKIAVTPILPGQIWKCKTSADCSAAVIGTKVTLTATTLDGVTATTTKGVAEIVDLCGAAASGDEILVRF